MQGAWVPCPSSWKLENVQAGLNVAITTLSFLASFIFVQTCWQNSARRAVKGVGVPLHSLVSVSAPGEVLGIVLLLRQRLLNYSYVKLWAQCVVVICFTGTAIFSGPIARYGSKLIFVPRTEDIPGLLASNSTFFSASQTVEWNLTYAMLDRANFPRDQLLDFLPSSNVNWTYQSNEWTNHSWGMDCQRTANASMPLVITDNCTNMWSELEGLDTILSKSQYPSATIVTQHQYVMPKVREDALFTGYGANPSCCGAGGNPSFNMTVVFLHLHGISLNVSAKNSTGCWFAGTGSVEQAFYSRIQCELTRSVPPQESDYHAHPILSDPDNYVLNQAFNDYFFGKFEMEVWDKSPVTVAPPENLERFYQVYMVVKDVKLRNPVTRPISVNIPTVHLSPVFLAIASSIASLVLIGLINVGIFAFRHWNSTAKPPHSRLDWMLQSIEAEDRPLYGQATGARKSVTVDSILGSQPMSPSQRQRAEFEKATYGVRGTTTWFHMNPGTSANNIGRWHMDQSHVNQKSRFLKHWSRDSDTDLSQALVM